MNALCLRCSTVLHDDHDAACLTCGEPVFLKAKHTAAVQNLLARATVAEKEALLEALSDLLGEDSDRGAPVWLDVDSIVADDGAYRATVTHRTPGGLVTYSLEEEPALAFLAPSSQRRQ